MTIDGVTPAELPRFLPASPSRCLVTCFSILCVLGVISPATLSERDVGRGVVGRSDTMLASVLLYAQHASRLIGINA